MSLDGRVAVVTGATKGVGRGIGRELAQHGARVFVTGRSAPDHKRLDKQVTRAAVVGGGLLGGRFIWTGTEKFVETAVRIRAFHYNRRGLG